MRWPSLTIACAALVGCGRLGFDPLSPPPPGDPDAATDGIPVDARAYFVNSLGAAFSDLYEIDLATGATTLIGSLDIAYNEINGLAALDANTLIATSFSGNLVRITLSPFSHAIEATGLGAVTGLEVAEDGTSLRGVGELVDLLQRFTPPTWTVSGALIMDEGGGIFDVGGGDLTRLGEEWFVWTNAASGPGLYRLQVTNPVAFRVEPGDEEHPEIVGMVAVGNRLVGVARDTDEIVEIDPTNGIIKARRPVLGIADVQFGDLALRP